MNELIKSHEQAVIKELKELNQEFTQAARKTVLTAIRMGELLTEVKEALPHGQFRKWLDFNTGFSHRMAARYMQAFEVQSLYKDKLTGEESLRELLSIATSEAPLEREPEQFLNAIPVPNKTRVTTDPEKQEAKPKPVVEALRPSTDNFTPVDEEEPVTFLVRLIDDLIRSRDEKALKAVKMLLSATYHPDTGRFKNEERMTKINAAFLIIEG